MANSNIKCPKCGSINTRDSNVKVALEVTGQISGKLLAGGLCIFTGFLGNSINRGISKGCGEIGKSIGGT